MDEPTNFEELTDEHFAKAIEAESDPKNKMILAMGWIQKQGGAPSTMAIQMLTGLDKDAVERAGEELMEGGLIEEREPPSIFSQPPSKN
jgi:hypothetical protein